MENRFDHNRPEKLFPLFASVTSLSGVGQKIELSYNRLAISRIKDLIFLMPISGKKRVEVKSIQNLALPSYVIIEVSALSYYQSNRLAPIKVFVTDSLVDFEIVFFNVRLDWVKKVLPVNQTRFVSGKIDVFGSGYQIINPDYIVERNRVSEIPKFEPVYPLTKGLSQKKIIMNIRDGLERVPIFKEWIREDLIKKYAWPSFKQAIESVHKPVEVSEVCPQSVARERLAYDELFAHQISLALARRMFKREKGIAIKSTHLIVEKILKSLPFSLTKAQSQTLREIFKDLESGLRMNRLLQGDVGSGKTIVALLSMVKVVEFGGQAAFLAPTDILAKQHWNTVSKLLEQSKIKITILTGSDTKRMRKSKLQEIQYGTAEIIIGTHAIFQQEVIYSNLRLVIIDEQHRFGVKQRMALAQKGYNVDTLLMTATPIPRSLALAYYGDMDFSILDEKPKNRKAINTAVKPISGIGEVLDRLEVPLKSGSRIYWVCPLVEDSKKLSLTSAQFRFQTLEKRFPGAAVGLVYGQMEARNKDDIMKKFATGLINILVSTTVVEVGVDVPEASIIIIEGAERFGLAQLHQLRGRVGRGSQESSCILLYGSALGRASKARLNILRETEDGFKISEEDLRIRGAGDVLGIAQSGKPIFSVASIEHHHYLMEVARADSRMFLDADPELLTSRGNAIRELLHLMDLPDTVSYIKIG